MLPAKVKKADAHSIPNGQRRTTGLVLLSASILTICLWLMVIPDIVEVYKEIELPLPWFLTYRSYLLGAASVVFGALGIYLLRTPPDYTVVDAITIDLADDQLIDTNKLITTKPELVALLLTLGWLSYLTIAIARPLIQAGKDDSLQIQTEIESINKMLEDSDNEATLP